MNEVVIAYITDNNYVMPTIVSITSAIMNKNENSIYKIYIIGVSINEENKNILEKFINENNNDKIKINILHFTQHYDFDDTHQYVTSAAIFKFDIANILSDYDKVLYLDCDTIILKDLTELFNIDINEYYAAAVKDYIGYEIDHWAERLGIKDYFNSGVMLLNTKILRENKIKELLLDYKINKDTIALMDQNCFNYIFNDRVKFIKPKYNYMRTIYKFDKSSLDKFFECNTGEDIVVLHITYFKPWNENVAEEKYFYDFWSYYQHTNYYKENPVWTIDKISAQKAKSLEVSFQNKIDDINSNLERLNNKIRILEEISYDLKRLRKIKEEIVNKIAWWIPIRKWRDKFREKFRRYYD